MSKPDYELKSKILKEYKNLDLYNKCQKVLYKYSYGQTVTYEEFEQAGLTLRMLEKNSPREYKEYSRISNAKCKRVLKLKKRIFDMIYKNDCLFLTLTFNNYSMEHNSADSRRQAVRRFLNSLNVPYVANIDFGAKNEREHYHAVVEIGRIDYKKWKYGAINGLKIRNDIKYDEDGVITSESVEKISRYVAKLTNHAIKETTKRSVIIYSRNKTSKRREQSELNAINRAVLCNDSPALDLYKQEEIKI